MTQFALPIFVGAFLLFQVQPLIARFILPWFGGSPAVWTTCMLFFQMFLLAGYAYAHATTRLLTPRKQAALHGVLLLAALAWLPIVPGAQWKPAPDVEPTGRILLLLTSCLGLPYLVLAATSPLLQAWFSRVHPGASPYRLYALSNVGSLLALVSYPFVFEPLWTRQTQARMWAWGFGAFVLLCGWCAWRLWRGGARMVPVRSEEERSAGLVNGERPDTDGGAATGDPSDSALSPTAYARQLWFWLPLCGSVLLLATTNMLCQDVAVIPFLWVLPLSLYLLTFILCFDHARWYARKSFTLLLIAMLVLLCDVLFKGSEVSLLRQVTVYCGSLFVGCMICHGEAYRLRPPARYLTSFYLLLAAGGAAGGLLVAVVAPLVFQSFAELHWGLWLLATLVLLIHTREKTRWQIAGWRLPLWPALGIGVVALGVGLTRQARQATDDTILRSRNFYGGLQVIELAKGTPYHAYKLQHGNTTHGLQFLDPLMATMPTTYFDEPSGVGLAMACFPRQSERRIGVVGLGVGTMAAYPQAGDAIRFYEINPEVRRLAETRFTYLKDCKGRVEVVMGDARLSLETEPSQQFDLLVLDAFSSDAIPLHLLTQEAFAIYLRHLKPDGVIAVHISNRYLNLVPVVRGVAAQFRLGTAVISRSEIPKPEWFKSSRWVLLSSNQDFLNAPPIFKATSASPMNSMNAVLWTDDHASLFRILK